MKKSRLKYAAIITFVLLSLSVIAMEIVLRVRCTFCSWSERNKGRSVSPYDEPLYNTWYQLRRPNISWSYKQREFDFALETNSLGIRDVEHPVAKQPNEFRIIGLGDSFTEGVGASFENTYLKILEKKLQTQHDGIPIRMILAVFPAAIHFMSIRFCATSYCFINRI